MKKVLALVLVAVLSLGMLATMAATPVRATAAEFDAAVAGLVVPTTVTWGGGRPYIQVTIGASFDLGGFEASTVSGANDFYAIKFQNGKTGAWDKDEAETGADTFRLLWNTPTSTSQSTKKLGTDKFKFALKDSKGKKTEYIEVGLVEWDPDWSNATGAPDFIVEYDGDDSWTVVSGQIVKITESGTAEMTFEKANEADILVEARVAKNAKFNSAFSRTTPAALEDAYPFDDLQYFAQTGVHNYGSWKVIFEEAEEGSFVYGYKDGKLFNLPANSWGYKSVDEQMIVTGTGTIPALVMSSTDLKITATGATTSTGTTTTPTQVPNQGTGR